MLTKIPIDETKDKSIADLEERLESLKKRASELRKKTYDTKLVDPFLFNITPKIKMAKATYDKTDFDKVVSALDWVDEQLKKIEENKDFPQVLKKTEDIYQFLRDGKIDEAKKLYDELREDYKNLDKDSQQTLYIAAMDIHKKIADAMSKD